MPAGAAVLPVGALGSGKRAPSCPAAHQAQAGEVLGSGRGGGVGDRRCFSWFKGGGTPIPPCCGRESDPRGWTEMETSWRERESGPRWTRDEEGETGKSDRERKGEEERERERGRRREKDKEREKER